MISITPAVKGLKIRNLGIIREADFKFMKGINIIYGVNGSGKTTVVNAIDHLACGENLMYNRTKKEGHREDMRLVLELAGGKVYKTVAEGADVKKVKIKTENSGKIDYYYSPDSVFACEAGKELSKARMTWGEFLEKGSKGERQYLSLMQALDRSCKGQALLLDDVFCIFDQEHKNRAFELLKKNKLQVIMTARREDELVKGANVIRLKFSRHRAGRQVVYS